MLSGFFCLPGYNVHPQALAQYAPYLEEEGIGHTRGKPYHPMTHGKIERCHRSLKNILLLEKYYSPSDFELEFTTFNKIWATFSIGPKNSFYIGAYRGFIRISSNN